MTLAGSMLAGVAVLPIYLTPLIVKIKIIEQ